VTTGDVAQQTATAFVAPSSVLLSIRTIDTRENSAAAERESVNSH
jgi:hypothetical protein